MIVPASNNPRIACVGTYVPRQCGIATFTRDLCVALRKQLQDDDACPVFALNDQAGSCSYPAEVCFLTGASNGCNTGRPADESTRENVDVLRNTNTASSADQPAVIC
ncbi:MAG: hypothetical protein R3C28_26165 [Pirellulaceae bacterium]